ncbi:MAG: hypothetical protein KBT21_08530 [Treponema sp.]|nr:hypothetical protein [Candidatus Treponema merdequi]
MWHLIAKAALGGIGGGLKEAGNSGTNMSGNNPEAGKSNDGMQQASEGMGKIFKKVKNTIAEKKKEKEQNNG